MVYGKKDRGMRKAASGLSLLAIVSCFLALLTGCARSTVGTFESGKLYIIIDMPSTSVEDHYLVITAEVEGYEPFVMKFLNYDYEERAKTMGLDYLGALDWERWKGQPVDLTEMAIKGGTEITLRVRDRRLQGLSKTFQIDGDVAFRVYVLNPEIGTQARLLLERLS